LLTLMSLTPSGQCDFAFLIDEQVFRGDGEVHAVVIVGRADYLRQLAKHPDHSGNRTAFFLAASPRRQSLGRNERLNQKKGSGIDLRVEYRDNLRMLERFRDQEAAAQPINCLPASGFIKVTPNHAEQIIGSRLNVWSGSSPLNCSAGTGSCLKVIEPPAACHVGHRSPTVKTLRSLRRALAGRLKAVRFQLIDSNGLHSDALNAVR
jgi:hypothetical protein